MRGCFGGSGMASDRKLYCQTVDEHTFNQLMTEYQKG